jgi:hypothetical protein
MSQSPNEVTWEFAGTADLSTSDRHKVLAAERRRVALDVLSDRSTPVDLEDLAVAIARRETDADVVDEEIVEQVAITLHHTHLPKMGELGVINYDPDSTVVESCPRRPDS